MKKARYYKKLDIFITGNSEQSTHVQGKKKARGIYLITNEIEKAGLNFCCFQEVRYRNSGRKTVRLSSGDEYEFIWCGKKRRRDAGVGLLIKVDSEIVVSDPEISDSRLMVINIKLYGFNIRLINAYSPTNVDGSPQQKDAFYRSLQKHAIRRRNMKS